VGTTDFDIPDEKKEALIQSGATCAQRYFSWFDDPSELPVNRL
jgi:NTE family protein